MIAAHRTQSWQEVVRLMRMDVRELGRDPVHAGRFLQRFFGSSDALAAQLRRSWGLNAHEMHAIISLWEFGRMTMSDLGRRIPLSRAAITTLTDRLERLGFVQRVPDPTDRRRILLEITDLAEEQFQQVHAAWNERIEQYVSELDPETWEQVVDVLADLRDLAREHADELRARTDLEPVAQGRQAGNANSKEGAPRTPASNQPRDSW